MNELIDNISEYMNYNDLEGGYEFKEASKFNQVCESACQSSQHPLSFFSMDEIEGF